jgi:cell wall-associated NlpC family hydrolase
VALLGSRYQLGGTSPAGGFDCSGFVRYVFAVHQLDVPRTVAEQYRVGREVARSHIGVGDLVFFSTTGPGPTHVGIVVDPVAQTFVHAPGTGSVVRVERFDTAYWGRRMLAARRLPLPEPPATQARSGP